MTPHPHFDDKDNLAWQTSYEAALAVARADGKKVFIEMGREACSNCRTLVESVARLPDVAPLLKEHFVAVASDCDAPEQAVIDLAMNHLQDAMMLPFVLFTDADGNFLAGSHGAVDPAAFRQTLESLVD